jgi:glycosyltransferase involved in cell wall biosynthesis
MFLYVIDFFLGLHRKRIFNSSNKNQSIFFVSTLKNSLWGGSEELWYFSALECLDKGWRVHVLIYDFGYLNEKLKTLENKGANIYRRPRKNGLIKRTLSRLTFFDDLFNPYLIIKRINPDLIIVTDGSTYYTSNDILLSCVLLKHFKERYFIICQSNSPCHLPDHRSYAINLFQGARWIYFVSEQNRKLAFHQLATIITNSSVIQNPFRLVDDVISCGRVSDGLIRFAVVGRLLISDKGQDQLLKALVNPGLNGHNFVLHFFGTGPDELYLKQLCQFYNVGKRVVFEGYVDDLNEIWEKCDALLMPSLAEGMSLSILEAMANAKVCVVSDVGGASEWITHGYNGFLFQPSNENSICETLDCAIMQHPYWLNIGLNAKKTITEKGIVDIGAYLINDIQEKVV